MTREWATGLRRSQQLARSDCESRPGQCEDAWKTGKRTLAEAFDVQANAEESRDDPLKLAFKPRKSQRKEANSDSEGEVAWFSGADCLLAATKPQKKKDIAGPEAGEPAATKGRKRTAAETECPEGKKRRGPVPGGQGM